MPRFLDDLPIFHSNWQCQYSYIRFSYRYIPKSVTCCKIIFFNIKNFKATEENISHNSLSNIQWQGLVENKTWKLFCKISTQSKFHLSSIWLRWVRYLNVILDFTISISNSEKKCSNILCLRSNKSNFIMDAEYWSTQIVFHGNFVVCYIGSELELYLIFRTDVWSIYGQDLCNISVIVSVLSISVSSIILFDFIFNFSTTISRLLITDRDRCVRFEKT